MERITIYEAQKCTSPNPITLVCAQMPDGGTNLAAISWWTYLANKPPMIGFAISKRSYTGELIEQTKRAILSIPGEALKESAFRCGCVSGRVVNKAKEFNIEMAKGFPVHSKLAFVCSLESMLEVGDHIFYACNVEEILYNPDEKQLYCWDGYKRLGTL